MHSSLNNSRSGGGKPCKQGSCQCSPPPSRGAYVLPLILFPCLFHRPVSSLLANLKVAASSHCSLYAFSIYLAWRSSHSHWLNAVKVENQLTASSWEVTAVWKRQKHFQRIDLGWTILLGKATSQAGQACMCGMYIGQTRADLDITCFASSCMPPSKHDQSGKQGTPLFQSRLSLGTEWTCFDCIFSYCCSSCCHSNKECWPASTEWALQSCIRFVSFSVLSFAMPIIGMVITKLGIIVSKLRSVAHRGATTRPSRACQFR